ncbi:hypothetical protein ACFWWC_48585 [Streptomyces sp. NPDC058642]|uniref:hypothetical protein n=1 Tax=Streptomyces sp. NPDC058642 TaxID=3346572 RepID=UPI0036622D78
MTSASHHTSASGTGLLHITGGRTLSGRIPVQGSKNIALHLYPTALLADAPVTLAGAPDIIDTGVYAQILHHTGAQVTCREGRFTVSPTSGICPVIEPELGRRARTTAVLAAAVLARTGQVAFAQPLEECGEQVRHLPATGEPVQPSARRECTGRLAHFPARTCARRDISTPLEMLVRLPGRRIR